jgi:flavodoxin I
VSLNTVIMLLRIALYLLLASSSIAWIPSAVPTTRTAAASNIRLDAAVGIFYGTSTGSTQECAEFIYEAFGSEFAAEPVDVDTIDNLAAAFDEHDALVVGTPTWNTGADVERSGTGWDELYYKKLPELNLSGKKVAVFGLGDQLSYSENYADATGELYDVFENLGCTMLGSWSMEGYEHEDSKSIRGDAFCGLLLDQVNQEELSEERCQRWVEQLKAEGILTGGSVNGEVVKAAVALPVAKTANFFVEIAPEQKSELLNVNSAATAGFTPHYNPQSRSTMWTSPDGHQSYVTAGGQANSRN